jgi:hypothetical protein
MVRKLDITALSGLLYGWLAGVVALTTALLSAVIGQALGAAAGGCTWIGASLPVDRQVWALVNQPVLNFASQPRAIGYWLGSLVVPAVFAVGVIHVIPRARTLASELLAVHVAWGTAVVGLAWLPLLDPVDGHLARWLQLTDLHDELIWLAPLSAVFIAILPTLRLLALARIARPHTGRGLRLAIVLLHFGVPCVWWVAGMTAIRGEPAIVSSLAVLSVLAVAAAVAWFGYPPAFVHKLGEMETASWVRLFGTAAVAILVLWLAGRPIENGKAAGILWGTPGAYNNVRPWIEATSAWPRSSPVPVSGQR